MKKRIIIVIIYLLTISCSNNTITESKLININKINERIVSIDTLINLGKVLFLQDTLGSEIGSAAEIIKLNNEGLYILDKWARKKLIRFDLNGLFLNSIGDIGNGPKEYNNIIDATFSNNEIWILTSQPYMEFFRYTPEGSFIDKEKLNAPASYSFEFSDNKKSIWFYTSHNQLIDGRLALFNLKENSIEKYFIKQNKNSVPTEGRTFSRDSELDVLFWEPLGNEIYRLNNEKDGLKEIIELSWTNENLNVNNLDNEELGHWMQNNKSLLIRSVQHFNQNIVVSIVELNPKQPPKLMLLIITDKNNYLISFPKNESYILSQPQFIDNEGNILFLIHNINKQKFMNDKHFNANPFVLKLNLKTIKDYLKRNE